MNTTKFIPLLTAIITAVSLTAYLTISTNMFLVNATTLDDQAHALTVKGIHSVGKGDYESAIRYYKEALKARPNDRGIQMALGQVFYLREKESGQIRPNPKVEVLLDALEYGKSDWEASIRYLENALEAEKDRPRAQAIRDALNYTKGLYAESIGELQFAETYRKLLSEDLDEVFKERVLRPLTMEELGRGFKSIEEGDYEQAIYSFKSALELNPNDPRIRDILSYAEGLNLGQYERMKRWAERQQAKYEKHKGVARRRETEAQNAIKQAQNALSLSEELDDAEAATISQRAINIAKRALVKAQALLLRLEARLQTVEKTRSLGSEGRVGVASVLKGKVFRKTAKGWVSFDAHAPLAAGDQLRTGADSFAEFVFTDGSIIHIAPNSTLTLHQIGEKSSTYELLKGRFHAEMECLKMTRDVCREVRMGRGFVLSVRGTEFDIDMVADGPTKITVLEGVVEVTNQNSGEKIEIAECGQAVISFDGVIEKPVPIKLNSINHWWEETP